MLNYKNELKNRGVINKIHNISTLPLFFLRVIFFYLLFDLDLLL